MRIILGKLAKKFAIAAVMVATSSAVQAQDGYPEKPVRIIVPSAAGGGLDTMARLIAQKLNEKLGVPFIVDNRPGAGGTIGISVAASASADGYTLVIISATHAGTSTLQGKGAYDLKRDFAPVIWASTQPYILNVNPKVPARNVKDLIALAKVKPDTLNYGSPGVGSAQHLAGLLFSSLSGARLFHVPYKGGSRVVNDIIGGQIQVSFTNYLICRPHIQAGRLRALAVTTMKRSPAIPDLPAVAEVLPGYDADNWYGLIAPAKSPPAILDMLHREISAILNSPEVKQRLAADATEIVSVTRAQFGQHIAQELVKWGDVIRKAGITTQ